MNQDLKLLRIDDVSKKNDPSQKYDLAKNFTRSLHTADPYWRNLCMEVI